jgi:hypothetical protein
MADPGGLPINFNWGNVSNTPKKTAMTDAEMEAERKQLEFQYQQQKILADIEREKAAKFERELAAGPQLKYNPLEDIEGPGGTKSFQLRKELQLEGPEKFVQSERERLGQQQALSLDDLQKQRSQIEAQQSGALSRFGLRGGNRALMSRYSMRDALMARQGLGRQFQTQAGELEAKGYSLGQAIKEKNLQNTMSAIKDVEQFNLEKWKKQKEVEASRTQAEATRDAGKK